MEVPFPSDSIFREAYPYMRTGVWGVMSILATPMGAAGVGSAALPATAPSVVERIMANQRDER